MIHFALGLYNSLFSVPEYRILIVGLDGAGKSVLMEQMKYMYHPNNTATGDQPAPIGYTNVALSNAKTTAATSNGVGALSAAGPASQVNGAAAPPSRRSSSSLVPRDSASAAAASSALDGLGSVSRARQQLHGKASSVSIPTVAATKMTNTDTAAIAYAGTGLPGTPLQRPRMLAGTPMPAPPSYLAAKHIRATVGMNYAKVRHHYCPLPVRNHSSNGSSGNGPQASRTPTSPTTERTLVMWDVGGAAALRALWENYFPQCQGLIYVVDASRGGNDIVGDDTAAAFKEDRATLSRLLNHPNLHGVPVLVFVNKMDATAAVSLMEAQDALGLVDLAAEVSFYNSGENSSVGLSNGGGGGTAAEPSRKGAAVVATAHTASVEAMEASTRTTTAVGPFIGTSGFGHIVMRVAGGSALDGTGVAFALDWLVAQLERSCRVVETDDSK